MVKCIYIYMLIPQSLTCALVSLQGLRTLELCVDNLQPDFLYEHIQPVRAELMQVLFAHCTFICGSSEVSMYVRTYVCVCACVCGVCSLSLSLPLPLPPSPSLIPPTPP